VNGPSTASMPAQQSCRIIPMPKARLLITEPSHGWRDAITARLDHLCRLPVGWDGYRAGPVSFTTANFALNVLQVICGPETLPPSIVPGTSGDLQIEWHLQGGDIELHFRAPYDVVAWRETPETGEDGEELELTIEFTQVAQWIKALVERSSAFITAAA